MELIPIITVVALGIQGLRKILETAIRLPRWDKVLSKVWLGSIVFFALSRIPTIAMIGDWYVEIIYVVLFITVYLLKDYRPALFDSSKSVSNDKVYALRDYRPARQLSIALLPIGIVYVISLFFKLLMPSIFEKNSGRFDTLETFAALWLIGFGIYAILQIKKERKLRLKLQEETQVSEARKAELEHLVTERTNQLTLQKQELENTLNELKSTQAQLIQSEKMASLGELTAGIAHEIQNPLNFVNNFAAINTELIDEMKVALDKGNHDEVISLARDISDNEQKIMFHGKRAESIVKGMLQHSRKSTDIKELMDINALADEYMRLSYHGLRAKDKSFNAEFKMNLDPSLPLIPVIPQDIGRVLLNLFNNAFWVVAERKKSTPVTAPSYLPAVTLTTKKLSDQKIEIQISDNGTGIPDVLKDKIFQPFFTTKPTGQGTGLGLSLSYDIVQAHGGSIQVVSNDKEPATGTTFIITLPI